MLDNRELKKLLVVILGIVVLLGVFVGVRSCTKADNNDVIQEDVNKPSDENNDINVEYEDEDKDEEKENTSNNYGGSTNTTVKDEVVTPSVEQVVQKEPVVTMKENYVVDVNSKFDVPTVTVDDNGEKVTTEISYEFLPLDSLSYVRVLKLDTSMLGTYRVTYKISNEYKTIVKVVYVEIVDNELPVIEANKKLFEPNGNELIETDIPVLDGSYVNGDFDAVYFSFTDNDKIAYAEYYKAIKEIVNGEETIEKEAMENVTEIDLGREFLLYEDGEYHIRVVDRSGNTTEFVVTIDKTPAVLEDKSINQDGDVTVTLTFDEKVSEVEGWTLSEDKKVLTKVYTANVDEIVTVKDLAGNVILVPVNVQKVIDVRQGTAQIRNEQNVNSENGNDINIYIDAPNGGELSYSTPNDPTNGGPVSAPGVDGNFASDRIFDGYGDYEFKFTDADGKVSTFKFTISDLPIGG